MVDADDIPHSIQHYRILDLLGEGGGGVVYKARDTVLDRVVVVKVLKDALAGTAQGRERFLREARLASALDHPNIASIYSISEEAGKVFIVMQFVEGESLSQRIARERPDLTTSLSISVQIADALAHAHGKGIIHRDVKPSNVMVTGEGQIKILDFGLAKRNIAGEAQDVTSHGQLIGTPLYLSPELARGEDGNEQSDIFSFGILFYQMLTGKLPFTGANRVEVLHAVTSHEPPAPGTVLRKIPPRLDVVVMRCLAKDKAQRYATMKQVLLELEGIARDFFHEEGALPALRPESRFKWFRPAEKSQDGFTNSLLGKLFNWTEPERLRVQAEIESQPNVDRRRLRSIAVLPFENAHSREDAAEGAALADRIATELTRVSGLTVAPWATLPDRLRDFDPADIARELGLDGVLTGTYLTTPGGWRASPRLLRADSGDTIWTDVWDFAGSDPIAFHDEAAQKSLRLLRGSWLGRPGLSPLGGETSKADAYEQARRGKHMQIKNSYLSSRREDFERAVAFYREALRLDPTYAKAQGELGVCHLLFVLRGLGGESHMDLAEVCFEKALALDPHLLEPRLYGTVVDVARGRKARARETLRVIHREYPDEPRLLGVAIHLNRLDGLFDAALRLTHLRDKVSPMACAEGYLDRGWILTYQGQAKLAIEEIKKGLELEPAHMGLQTFLAHALYYRGEIQEAHDLLQKVRRTDEEPIWPRLFLAMCHVRLGQHKPALSLLDSRLQSYAKCSADGAYWLAGCYAAMLEKAEAMRWLERAVALGCENYPWFVTDFNLLNLREEPVFVELLKTLHRRWEDRRETLRDASLHAETV